ncbi:MAG: zinc-binding dehydrogenase [Candidatus Latescibacteria bacterium]|nr:zinc-binding dehydrogenase [Candidatus Latescibacterota bacterium]
MEKAKAIVFERPGEAVIRQIRLPEIDDETIVVKTHYSAISTGTELSIYNGLTPPLDGNLWYPLVPGYEEVGEVVRVGDKVGDFKVGDRVMANEVRVYPGYCAAWGGQVEYAVKNPQTSPAEGDGCVKIPENVTYQEAVIAYLAGVARKGIEKVGIEKGDTVLILGQGVIGLSASQLAKLKGATVIVADLYEERLEVGRRFADYAIDTSCEQPLQRLKEITGNELADVVFEVTGDSGCFSQAIEFVKPEGQIHYQGYYANPIIITQYHRWFVKDPTITMTCALRSQDKKEILSLISQGKFDAKSLITKEVSVDDAPETYEESNNNRDKILKVLFSWR